LHRGALRADAASVDQPHLAQPGVARGVQVRVHHRQDIARRERMQIEHLLDRHHNGVVVWVHGGALGLGSWVLGLES